MSDLLYLLDYPNYVWSRQHYPNSELILDLDSSYSVDNSETELCISDNILTAIDSWFFAGSYCLNLFDKQILMVDKNHLEKYNNRPNFREGHHIWTKSKLNKLPLHIKGKLSFTKFNLFISIITNIVQTNNTKNMCQICYDESESFLDITSTINLIDMLCLKYSIVHSNDYTRLPTFKYETDSYNRLDLIARHVFLDDP